MDSTITCSSTTTSNPQSSSFLSLPEEIQKEIVSHCSQTDWICLSLVSSHFRELAASHLYRNFHIVFPDDDDTSFDSPIDGLAGGLDTFVTSDYNYAKHLRDISLDTLSTGLKAESAYKAYVYSASCGKFMNTLLLLTLRKAKSLDTFKWNIRVKLSRPVYRALHNIKSLRHLHLRLQAGSSLYEPPPPLPSWSAQDVMPGIENIPPGQGVEPPLFQNPLTYEAPSSLPAPYMMPVHFPAPADPTYKPSKHRKKPTPAAEPPTLSGFKGLETLSVLDIDNLDIVSEIRSCVRNSASTLRSLELSFSDHLAAQARKPNLETDPEDSDQEDEFQLLPVSLPPHNDGSGPAKIFRAQQERKVQEAVLGQIFEVEPSAVNDNQPVVANGGAKKNRPQTIEDAAQVFIDTVGEASRRMWANLEGSSSFDMVSQEEALAQIMEAARLVVESKEAQTQETPSTDATVPPTVSPDLAAAEPVSHRASDEQDGPPGKTLTVGSGLFGSHGGAENTETSPDDIDVEAPEEQLCVEGQEEANVETFVDESKPRELPANSLREITHVSTNEDAALRREEVIPRIDAANISTGSIKARGTAMATGMRDSETQNKANADQREDLEHQVTEYARGTRGISLEALAIHLIPTKPRVLSKAIDLRTLKKITLLNVGPQATIWAIMLKENMQGPLPLQRIYTDNVCQSLLNLVSQLKRVDEIYLLERGPRSNPESFAPGTSVNIEQIKKHILKKHMETLEILMIKNEADCSWDIDDRTMQLICKRGKALEEMAVSMGIRAMHTFLQRMTGLQNLHTLHVLSFRSDDTCISVMREMRRFIVDTLSHHRDMNLEWIAVGDDGRAQRVIRPQSAPSSKKTGKNNEQKWKAPPVDANGNPASGGASSAGAYPLFPANGWEPDSESEDEDDWDAPGLVLSESTAFYDIWGVQIFRKEIVAGRV